MKALPQDGFGVEYGDNVMGLSPRMDFQVQFTCTGTHSVWIRGWGSSGFSDSVYVGLDGVLVASAAHLALKPWSSWI